MGATCKPQGIRLSQSCAPFIVRLSKKEDYETRNDTVDRSDEQVTTEFLDTAATNDSADVPGVRDSTGTMSKNLTTLGDFLKRPVLIYTDVWDNTANFDVVFDINPWELFLGNPAVVEKVNHFQLVKGDLNVRILVNGSNFFYGLLKVAYLPYSGYWKGGDLSGVVQISQLPGGYLMPSSQTELNMVLPFVSGYKWIDLAPVGGTTSRNEKSGADLGRIFAFSLDLLRSANTTPPVADISIYAWMENPELAVPTMHDTVFQMRRVPRDEYSNTGPVSSVASAVASAAGSLRNVPIIGPFAKATQVVGDAVGSVASLFGFSNPTQIDPPSRVHIDPFVPLALTGIKDSAHKLALDARNEITIDPGVMGLEGIDSMSVSHIAGRECYLKDFVLDPTDLPGAVVSTVPVTPGVVITKPSGVVGKDVILSTPQFWLTRAFAYWTGGMTYRVVIPATPYHRGRLQVCYCPRGYNGAHGDPTNVAWNKVIDIGSDTEFEFTVPWTAVVPYLPTTQVGINDTYDSGNMNGELVFRVVNPIRGPETTFALSGFIFQRAADDFKVAKPYGKLLNRYATWTTDAVSGWSKPSHPTSQWFIEGLSNPEPYGPVAYYQMDIGPTLDGDKLPLMHMGEAVESIRPLIKRSGLVMRVKMTDDGSAYDGSVGVNLPMYAYDGYQSGLVPTDHSYSLLNTFYTYFRSGFLAVRGGSRYRAVVRTHDRFTNETISGAAGAYLSDSTGYFFISDTVGDINDTMSGAALTARLTQDAVEVEVPNYFPRNFCMGTAMAALGNGLGGSDYGFSPNSVTIWFDAPKTSSAPVHAAANIDVYHAGADDATFDWFVCAPWLYDLGDVGRVPVEPPPA